MTFDFNQLKKRFQPDTVVELTLESDRVFFSLVKRGVSRAAPVSLNISLQALLENPAQAGTELTSALGTAGIRERRCVVCFPPSLAMFASIDLPEAVASEDLRSYLELRAEKEFSTPDLRLAYSAYVLPDGRQRATLAAVPVSRMETIEKMLAVAGLRPLSIAISLGDCCSKPEPMMHLLVHPDETDVVISIAGGIAAIRSLANPNPTDPSAFVRELRITMGRLPEAVRQQLRRARIVGGRNIISRGILDPSGVLEVEELDGVPGESGVKNAEKILQGQLVFFEFIVSKVKRLPVMVERFNTKRGRQVAAAIVALLLIPLFVFFARGRMESSNESKWNGIKNNVADLEALQQKIRRFRPWFQPAPQKLEALRILISAFPERGDIWTRSVQITNTMEKGEVGTRAVQGSTLSSVNVSGYARSREALLNLQNSLSKQPGVTALQLKQIRGNNPITFSLSYKWEPKHE